MITITPTAPAREIPGTTTEPLMLPAHVLRQVAEWASGVREPRWFVVTFDPETSEYSVRVEKQDPGPVVGAVVIPARSDFRATRPAIKCAVLGAEGANPVDLLELEDRDGNPVAADCVFWTESAVEKFMLPYYASVFGSDAGARITELLRKFNGEAGIPPGEENPEGDSTVYGLVHIPKSEYIDLGANTGMIVRHERLGQSDQLAVLTLAGELLLPAGQARGTGDRAR